MDSFILKGNGILSVKQKKILKDIDANLLFCYQQPWEKGVAVTCNSIKILNNLLHPTILFLPSFIEIEEVKKVKSLYTEWTEGDQKDSLQLSAQVS